MSYVVEVNEINVFTYSSHEARDWWQWYRMANPAGRFFEHHHTPAGSLVEVSCDSKADAEWLAKHMVNHGGLNKSAVKVKRATSAGEKP